MIEFKGTRGSWEQIHVSNDRGDYHKVMSGNVSICNITTRNETESEANAKLISHSPEMLDLLNKTLIHLKTTQGNSGVSEDIEQLISKITE